MKILFSKQQLIFVISYITIYKIINLDDPKLNYLDKKKILFLFVN